MRIVSWVMCGLAAGVLAGFATGLLRRHPVRLRDPLLAYAGGYSAPTPSLDHTAVQPRPRAVVHSHDR